jgi:hypothetical protein
MGKKVGSRTLWKDLKLVVMPWINSAISAITGLLSYSQPQTLTPTEQAQALSNLGVSGPPLTEVAVSSPLAGKGTTGDPLTTPAQLWEISAGKLRYPLWPASLNLDVANGHVGINGTSNINWDTVGAGTWMLTAPKLMIKGPTMAESTLIGAATISPANPVLELVTAFPFSGNSSYMGIEFELIEGNGKRAVISASFVFGSLGNIASHEMSLNGNADPAGISVWIGTDAGVVKISMQDTLLGGNANVSIRVIHRTATVMESYAWTVTALPSPPAWTSNPTPNTQLITGNQAVNRFGKTVTTGQTIFSRNTNGVQSLEQRVKNITSLIPDGYWAEINTHWLPAVDGTAQLCAEFRHRVSFSNGTPAGIVSFTATAALAISNVSWSCHGGRLPVTIGVGVNTSGEVVILFKDNTAYGLHVEALGHVITNKKEWDVATYATDPSGGYTTYVPATIANAFGQVNAASLTVAGSASVGGALAVVGPVTGASFTTPSDPSIKGNVSEFGSWIGDLIDSLTLGTFDYNGSYGFTGQGAGVLDAGKFRDALPVHLRDGYAPQVAHKDRDALLKHEEKWAKRQSDHDAKRRERQEKREEKRKRKEEKWAELLKQEDGNDEVKLKIDQEEIELLAEENAEVEIDETEAVGIELASLNELGEIPSIKIGMVNNTLLLAVSLAEIKSLRERVKSLEKKSR